MADKKNTIGRFEILEKIGEGPIGAVYKALDPVIRRTVAIKVIKLYALEETSTFAEVFEKIYRVVRTSTALNHPNICIIYDLSEEKKIPYITMEYVEGHDLDSLLQKKHQFKRGELLNVLQQVCDALDFAHRKGVIHQDLKASNILITPDLNVKITDFGIAGLDEIAAAQTKKLLSIPYYISPEQALGERVSPSSDLFSLGVVVYQLLCGHLPFPGTNAANTLMMVARDHPAAPPSLQQSQISADDWDSFFSIALAKSTNHRFRSAQEMFEALSAILPPSDQLYYPYTTDPLGGDSTGKLQDRSAETEFASPTVMIDASKILDEAAGPDPVAVTEPDIPAFAETTNPNLMFAATEISQANPDKTELITEEALQAHARSQGFEHQREPEPEPVAAATMPPQAAATELIHLSRPTPVNAGMAVTHVEPARVEPATILSKPFSEPTKLINADAIAQHAASGAPTRIVSAAELAQGAPAHAEPMPVGASPAAPAVAAKPASAPPNLQRYYIAAIILAFFIAIAGLIFFIKMRPSADDLAEKAGPAQKTQEPTAARPTGNSPATAVANGKISITSDPAGAVVYLDDQEKAKTPIELADLQLGAHTLKLQLNGYKDYVQNVELTAQAPMLSVPVTLEKAPIIVGTLIIESEPSDAFIVLGSRVVGVTPRTLSNTKIGRYKITLKKDGFEDYVGTVRVTENKSATLRAELIEIPTPVPPAPVKPAEPTVKPGQLVTIGPGVTQPRNLKKTFTKYPRAAKAKEIEGVVGMNVLVSETGKVLDVKITRSAHPLLDDAALSTVKEWVYEPATKNGIPVKMWITVSISFQIR